MAGEDDDGREDNPTLRAVGERLGGWARRVGKLVADVSGRPLLPEPLREPVEQARHERVSGHPDRAQVILRENIERWQSVPQLRFALGLSLVYDFLGGGRPVKAMEEVIEALGESLDAGPRQLLRGALELFQGKPEPALDQLRRAANRLSKLGGVDEVEARFVIHLLGALAQLQLGNEERALRELQKARARMPQGAGSLLRHLVLRHGVDLSLAAGEVVDAESWVRESLAVDPEDLVAKGLLARSLAAKRDRVGAHALLDELGEGPEHDLTRLYVGLIVGLPGKRTDLRQLAMRVLQVNSEDPDRRRAWALAELIAQSRDAVIADGTREQIVEALAKAAAAAPAATRDRYLQELAHVALRLEWPSDTVLRPVLTRLERDEGTAPEELRLIRARHRLASNDPKAGEDFLPGPPPRFRAEPDVGGPFGPDPRSPLRDPDVRIPVLTSQRSLAAAEYAVLQGQRDAAQDLLVEALVEWPHLKRAREMLAELVHPETGSRLEDLLTGATTLLASVPNRVLGLPLAGVQDALARVIAARERLVRPLTIAIMGEFSAGKSTFVNALLGEAVAPMGVLPTTTTINVFRRGAGQGARVHYRDGRIAMLGVGEVHRFLHGLDSTEASRIRHVEIERTGSRMGDASVVDTPGLNALDPYHEQVAREFLDEADAVVWVFSATRSGAASEVGMLASLRASGRQVLGVLNKVDTLDDAERTELKEYLRQQLGEVLVDIVPLRAKDALAYRSQSHASPDGGEQPQGEDPFAPVEHALEHHFLARARELKRALTARRLGEALTGARVAVLEAVDALERRANEAGHRAHAGRTGAEALVLRFADAVREGVLALDDVLTRESLGIGVLQTGKGLARGPLDPLDVEYLSGCFRDAAVASLRRALAAVAREDAAASEVLDFLYVPWARGHLEGLIAADFVHMLVRQYGPDIARGEAAVRSSFRTALQGVAQTWADRAKSLVHDIEIARNRADRRSTSAPRAEALRLRSAVVTSIDALRQAVDEVGPSSVAAPPRPGASR